jgi:hypothetical protein
MSTDLDDLSPAARLALVGALPMPGYSLEPCAAPHGYRVRALHELRQKGLAAGFPPALTPEGVDAATAILKRYGSDA